MATEPLAAPRESSPVSTAERDYQSFSEALNASERGRAFLQEFARRNRHADTEVVLAALDRLEETARGKTNSDDAGRIRQDLRALLETLRSARSQVDNSPGAIKAATLAALIDFAQSRIEAMVAAPDSPRGHGVLAQTVLQEVPLSDQPELPIPRPEQQQPVFALVTVPVAAQPVAAPAMPVAEALPPAVPVRKAAPAHAALSIPVVEFDYTLPPVMKPVAPVVEAAPLPAVPRQEPSAYDVWPDEPVTKIVDAEPPVQADATAPARPKTAIEALVQQLEQRSVPVVTKPEMKTPPAADPLEPIKMLSEAERLALFT